MFSPEITALAIELAIEPLSDGSHARTGWKEES
jgi:hypothetical protein